MKRETSILVSVCLLLVDAIFDLELNVKLDSKRNHFKYSKEVIPMLTKSKDS
jgi:hypothetical protein